MLFYLFIKLIIRKKSEKLVKILIKISENYIKKNAFHHDIISLSFCLMHWWGDSEAALQHEHNGL